MNPLLRHHSRCVYLDTLVRNILLALITMFVVSVHSVKHHMRAPRPEFLSGKKNITVREGGVAILPCSVRYLGTKQVAWRRIEMDQFLTIGKFGWTEDNHISLEYSKHQGQVSNFNLVIKRVTPDDQGIYECQITSRIGRIRRVQLNVVGPPISDPVISISGRQYVDLGDKIELKCNASGGARVADEMDWFKAGDKIDSDKYSHVIIEKYKSMETRSFISILIIERSRLQDTGDYICRSSRNDIANMKVTVLHAEGDKQRRGTENGRTQGSYQVAGSGGDGEGRGVSNTLSPSVCLVAHLLCACLGMVHIAVGSNLQRITL